jgi:hypothetical protein
LRVSKFLSIYAHVARGNDVDSNHASFHLGDMDFDFVADEERLFRAPAERKHQ